MGYLAILAGTFLVMFLGWLWFHPKVMGKAWMEGAGLTDKDMENPNPLIIVGALLMAAVVSYAMSRYAGHTEEGMHQFVHGMYHGFMPAILYVAPVLVSKSLFEQKSLSFILITVSYWVLAFTLMGGVVYALTPLPVTTG